MSLSKVSFFDKSENSPSSVLLNARNKKISAQLNVHTRVPRWWIREDKVRKWNMGKD